MAIKNKKTMATSVPCRKTGDSMVHAQASILDSAGSMDDSSLKELLDQTRISNRFLSKEVRIFEKFMKRVDVARDVQLKSAALPSSPADPRAQKQKAKSKGGSTPDKIIEITADQKCDIATKEVDELREEQQRKKCEYETAQDYHKAVVDEAEIRLADIQRYCYEFDREIVRGGVNLRTGQILGEKVVRYYEETLKSKDTLVEKLRLKNSSLYVKKRKLGSQLKAREEAGDVRTEVDFEQLKIENQQLCTRFDEKNQQLLKLKLSSANTLQVLNSYKKKLQVLMTESESLDSEIKQRRELLGRIDSEDIGVGKEKAKADDINAEVRKKLENFRVPDVMEYVSEQANLYELNKKVKAWERKVEIAEMAVRSYRQTWSRLSGRAQEHTQRHLDPLQP